MRRISLFFVVCFGLSAAAASAQSTASTAPPDMPKWDIAASVGLLSANPLPAERPYGGGGWYFEGRYAASIGRYWTKHLKTELEFATSTEGERYVQRFSTAPGVPPTHSYTAFELHTLRQVSGRVVWQFYDNAWVHPYVFAGVVYDNDRQEVQVPPQFYYPEPRLPASPMIPLAPSSTGPETIHRIGVTAGAGAKIYLSHNGFFNAALVMSHAKPARTASIIGGFGLDF